MTLSHHEEVTSTPDIPLVPDFGQYLALEQAGYLNVFTARHNDDLQGYAVFHLKTSLQTVGLLQAVQDLIFMRKEIRGFGGAFVSYCERELARSGVKQIYMHVTKKRDFGPLLTRKGFRLIENLYLKEV